MTHRVKEILIDDDQDAIWLKVEVEGLGASCHVGYKSCFYRKIINEEDSSIRLEFTEEEKYLILILFIQDQKIQQSYKLSFH